MRKKTYLRLICDQTVPWNPSTEGEADATCSHLNKIRKEEKNGWKACR